MAHAVFSVQNDNFQTFPITKDFTIMRTKKQTQILQLKTNKNQLTGPRFKTPLVCDMASGLLRQRYFLERKRNFYYSLRNYDL